MNSLNIIGNLTADPQTRYMESGLAVSDFGIAVNESKDSVSFYSVNAYGKTAETIAKHFTKGRKIAISGHLKQNRWTAKDGTKRHEVIIIADRIDFVDAKAQPPKEEEFAAIPEGFGEELPFN